MKRATSVLSDGRPELGFTTVELVIAMVLVGIIAASGALLAMEGTRAYIAQSVRADLTSQGRLGTERMVREIRTIRSRTAADIPTMTATTLSFVDLDGNAVTYTAAGGSVTRNGVTLSSADTATLNFAYFQADGTPAVSQPAVWVIEATLILTTGGESQVFRVRAHPRNLV